ncbi:MAG TPA: flagellar motor switch protein FliG [Candidatus Limnocylindria bacterium]|nr:flagellar motor switch protein FliG [Candidatus Limnocylindria bacterium]
MASPASTPRDEVSPEAEFSTMSKTQKLAAFLVMLGPEAAAHILKSLSPNDVDAICTEMAKRETVPQDLQKQILQEFSPVAIEAGTAVRGGLEFTRTTLEKAVGQFRANDVINRVAPVRAPLPATHCIDEMESRQLLNLVCHEQPQTIALVLSYLNPEKAAQLSDLLPSDLRDQVIARLATLEPTPVEVVEKVIEVLRGKAGARQTRALNQTGGVTTAAEILNAMDRSHSKALLLNLEKSNPDLTRAIRQKMFTFEDLLAIEVSVLQQVLRDVDMRDLALALKTASEKLKSLILGSVSKRAAEGVREEIAFMTTVKPRDIEAAQTRIIDAVRKIESENEATEGESQEGQNAVA